MHEYSDLSPSASAKGTAKFQRNGLVLTLALFLGLPLAALTFYMFVEGSSEKAAFYVYVSWFLLFGISYLEVFGVRSRLGYGGPGDYHLALLELGLVPIWRVSTGADIVDGDYVRAMFLVAAGFTMFWIGSWVTLRKITLSFVPLHPLTVERTTFIGRAFPRNWGGDECVSLESWIAVVFGRGFGPRCSRTVPAVGRNRAEDVAGEHDVKRIEDTRKEVPDRAGGPDVLGFCLFSRCRSV